MTQEYNSIGGKRSSSLTLTNLLQSTLTRKELSLQYQVRVKKKKSLTASTSMGYGIWWLVPSKNGSLYSNWSILQHVQSLIVHLYGKVEGM